MKAVASVEPRPAKIVNSEVPPALSELIQRLLAKNPEDRPATAQGVVDVLATLERSPRHAGRGAAFAAAGAPLPTLRDQPPPGRAPRRLVAVLAVAAGLVVLVGGGWLLGQVLFPAVPDGVEPNQKIAGPRAAQQQPVRTDPPMSFVSLVSAPTHIKGLKSWTIEVNDTEMPGRVVFSPDGRYLSLERHDTSDGKPQAGSWDFARGTLEPPGTFVPPPPGLVTSPDGKRQARVVGKTLELFKTGDPGSKLVVRGLVGVSSFAFSPNSELVAVAAADDGVVVVDARNAEVKANFLKGFPPHNLGWSVDGKTLFVSNHDDFGPQLNVVEPLSGKLLKKHQLNKNYSIRTTVLSPDARLVAEYEDADTLVVADSISGKVLHRRQDLERGALKPVWSGDGKWLAYPGKVNLICLLDVGSGKVTVCRGHKTPVSVVPAPDGKTFASTAEDNTTRLWSATTGAHLGSLVLLKNGGWLAVSPDGHYRGSLKPPARNALIYRVKMPDDEARELSPADFDRLYGWQNQPERVRLTEEARGRLAVDQPAEKK
jgi:WD40 repeat protein